MEIFDDSPVFSPESHIIWVLLFVCSYPFLKASIQKLVLKVLCRQASKYRKIKSLYLFTGSVMKQPSRNGQIKLSVNVGQPDFILPLSHNLGKKDGKSCIRNPLLNNNELSRAICLSS